MRGFNLVFLAVMAMAMGLGVSFSVPAHAKKAPPHVRAASSKFAVSAPKISTPKISTPVSARTGHHQAARPTHPGFAPARLIVLGTGGHNQPRFLGRVHRCFT